MEKTAYSPALNAALETTQKLLFSPFELSTWLVLGFSAWMSGITPASFQFPNFLSSPNSDFTPTKQVVQEGISAFHQNPVILLTLTGIGLTFLFGFIVLAIWIQSRSAFIFLDGVVSGHAAVVEPWKAWKKEGNSFFRWSLGFSMFSVIILGAWVAGIAVLAATSPSGASLLNQPALLGVVVLLSFIFLLTVFIFSSIGLIARDFIIPLMALHKKRVLQAWKLFIPLFKMRFAGLIGYIFLRIGLGILATVLTTFVTLLACCLCCIGLLLAFPYVGTVALLPVPVFFRAFSLHFLAQFGEQFDAWTLQRPAG